MKTLLQIFTLISLFIPFTLFAQGPGYALQFDGVEDYLTVPDGTGWPVDTNAFTIEAWVKFNTVPFNAIMLGQDEGAGNINKWIVGFLGSTFYFHINKPGASGINPIQYSWTPATGIFYHLAVTRQGAVYTLYINGSPVVSGNDATPIPDVNSDLTIGQAEGFYFNGVMDDIRIWNIARTQSEIDETMYHQLFSIEPGLSGNWRFDENGGVYAYNITGTNDGTFVNTPEWIASAIPFAASSVRAVVSAASEVKFSGASLFSMFQTKTETDTIVVSKLQSAVQGTTPSGVSTLHFGYWVVKTTDNGAFNADLTFGLGAGALTLADQENPSGIKLFRRDIGSTAAWTLVGAASAASFGSVTFTGITAFGEFAIGTSTTSSLNGTGGNFQSTASGTWGDGSNWFLIGGSDEDGIPDGNDDVVIRAGDQITYSSGGYVHNLLLLGASAGTRLSIIDNIGLYLYGILNSDATKLSTTLITTGTSASVNFVGDGRQVIGNKWSGDVVGWTVNISLSDTARVLTDFKAGILSINSPTKIGTYDAPKNLYLDGGSENSGSLSINGSSLFVSGNITRDSTYTSKCNSITSSWATIEIGGTYVSAENIKFGWPDTWYLITTTLRIRSTLGLLINAGSYTHCGTLEYIGTSAQTSGNELISISNINIKNPAGVQFLSSVSVTNVYLDTGSVTLPQDITLTMTNLFAKQYSILGPGNVKIAERVETAHANGLPGVFQNTGTTVLDNWSYTIVYNGSVPQQTGTLHSYFKDMPLQYISFIVDNPSGLLFNGSYHGNILTLTKGNITVNSPDTLSFNTLTAGVYEIHGTGMYIQQPGSLLTAHINGIDGTIQTAEYMFVSPISSSITFNGSLAQNSGTRLPDSLGGLTIQNSSGFTFNTSLCTPGFDLSAQWCDLNLSAGVTFRTGSFSGGQVRKMYGGGNFILTNGGNFSTQHPAGINGTLQLSGDVALGDSGVFSFGEANAVQVTGSLLPDTVQSIYFSNSNGTSVSKPFQVRDVLGIQSGILNNATQNVTLWNGATLQPNGGTLATIPHHQNYYDVNYAGWTGSTGNEIPDSSTVLRHLLGGNWITLTKNVTVNGNVENHVHTNSFSLRVGGNIAPYMILGHLRRYVSTPKEYVWEIADKDAQRYHPFTLGATALQDSDDITVTLYDTAVVQIPSIPVGQKILRYYYTAEQHRISQLSGTISLTYNDGDVNTAGIPDDDSLRIMQWKDGLWKYVDVISRDKGNNVITAGPIDTLTTFIIVGTELKGIASYSKKEILFGNVLRPEMKYDTLYIKNTGSWPLQMYSVGFVDPYTFGGSLSSDIIAIGDSVMLVVWFNAYHGGTDTYVFVSHNGTTGMDTIVLKGKAIYPAMTMSSSYPDFGTVPVGDSKKDSVMIYNTGSFPLIISELIFSSPHFTAVMTKATIAASDSAILYIVFAPQAEGTFNEWITLRNNIYGSGDDYRIYPHGTATASQFEVVPVQLSFGNVRRGESKKDSVVIKNPGAAVLHVSSITCTVGGYIATPSTVDVPASDSTWVTVTFAPQSQGDYNGELIFYHSASTTSPDSVHVTGTGIEPVFTADKLSFNFGSNVVGSMRIDSLFVTNSGNDELYIASIVSSDSIQFKITPTTAVVNPNEKQKFTVTFAPALMGTQSGNLKFFHNGNPDTNIVAMTGFGILPVFSVTRRIVDIGEVRVDSMRSDTITITNAGNTSLAVTSITVSDSQFTVSPTSVILNSGSKKEFILTFNPLRPRGNKKAVVLFRHNGALAADTVMVKGTATEPVFSVDRTMLSFGKVLKGQISNDSVVVTNTGNAILTISKTEISDSSFFVIPGMAIILPSATLTVRINF
ncbi:MAG: choice-of-anchor D domain-containing protein, partial [Bacteroidetes bacterium]|nr:choice-of-anchor D domain-containing protein [Bacteroidota bacterium]